MHEDDFANGLREAAKLYRAAEDFLNGFHKSCSPAQQAMIEAAGLDAECEYDGKLLSILKKVEAK